MDDWHACGRCGSKRVQEGERTTEFTLNQLACLFLMITGLVLSFGMDGRASALGPFVVFGALLLGAWLWIHYARRWVCADCSYRWRGPRGSKASKTGPPVDA